MIRALGVNNHQLKPSDSSIDRVSSPKGNYSVSGRWQKLLPLIIGVAQFDSTAGFTSRSRPAFIPQINSVGFNRLKQPALTDTVVKLEGLSDTALFAGRKVEEFNDFDEPIGHESDKERMSRSGRTPFYLEDWQACGANPSYRDIFENGYSDVALLNQSDIQKLFDVQRQTKAGDIDLTPTVHLYEMGDCAQVEVSAQEAQAVRKVVDLLQLSSMEFKLPFGIVMVRPGADEGDVREQLEDLFAPEITDGIIRSLYFDQTGKPQKLAVDMTKPVLEILREQVSQIKSDLSGQKHREQLDQQLIHWMGQFYQSTKSYYDQNSRGINCSELAQEMFTLLVKTAVLDPDNSGLPPIYIVSLMNNREADQIFQEAGDLYLGSFDQQDHEHSYENYVERTRVLEALGVSPAESDAFFDRDADIFVDYASKAYLAVAQDVPETDVYQQLEALFPAIFNQQDREKAQRSLPLTPNGAVVLPYKLPIKHLVKREAERLVDLLESNQAIKDQMELYNLIRLPFVGDEHSAEYAQTTHAIGAHFKVQVSEIIVKEIEVNGFSPALMRQPKLPQFLMEWLDIYNRPDSSNGDTYERRLGVLLDKYFEDRAGRV